MNVACDFCGRLAERHEGTIFVEAPSKLVHICEECIDAAATVVAAKKKEDKTPCSDSPDPPATASACMST